MTLTEVIVAVFVVLLLAVVLLPVAAYRKPKSNRINCVNNLKEVGLACKIWEGDNNDKYPAQISVLTGGAMELAATGNVVACFNLAVNDQPVPSGVVNLGTNIFTWTKDRHQFGGNIVLSDGSAAQVYHIGYTQASGAVIKTNRLAIP